MNNRIRFFGIYDLLYFIHYDRNCEPTRFAFGYLTENNLEKQPEIRENLTAAECFNFLLDDALRISNETGTNLYNQLYVQETKSHIVLQIVYEEWDGYVTGEFKEAQSCGYYDDVIGCYCVSCHKGFECLQDAFDNCLEYGECKDCTKPCNCDAKELIEGDGNE